MRFGRAHLHQPVQRVVGVGRRYPVRIGVALQIPYRIVAVRGRAGRLA